MENKNLIKRKRAHQHRPQDTPETTGLLFCMDGMDRKSKEYVTARHKLYKLRYPERHKAQVELLKAKARAKTAIKNSVSWSKESNYDKRGGIGQKLKRMWRAMANGNKGEPGRKRGHLGRPACERLLSCSAPDFWQHIQSQLDRYGWTWADYRTKWTMDHVIPVRKFKLPEEQRSCWHYTNMRPLCKHKNRKRSLNPS